MLDVRSRPAARGLSLGRLLCEQGIGGASPLIISWRHCEKSTGLRCESTTTSSISSLITTDFFHFQHFEFVRQRTSPFFAPHVAGLAIFAAIRRRKMTWLI
jgi:hypothetical protein